MTATSRKQGACFPADLWEAIKQQAEEENITPSKVIVKSVRETLERKNKKGGRK